MWDVDFGNSIHGGKVYVYYKLKDNIGSQVFYIRGTNPTVSSIRGYLSEKGYNEWFLIKLIRQESSMLQFVPGGNFGTTFNDTIGCPLLGEPRGFGLKQLDNFGAGQYPTSNEIWNWKANIDRGVRFLRETKTTEMNNRMNGYIRTIRTWDKINSNNKVTDSLYIGSGANTGTTVLTIQEGNATNHETFAITPTGTPRNIKDAMILRYYNGGIYLDIGTTDYDKPYWIIYRLNNLNPPKNYVEDVCNENP